MQLFLGFFIDIYLQKEVLAIYLMEFCWEDYDVILFNLDDMVELHIAWKIWYAMSLVFWFSELVKE